MSLLRRSRAELAGAWRSLRYDMGRHPAPPEPGGPDVTSTGMSTFGGAELIGGAELTGDTGSGDPVPAARRNTLPRWAVACTAFGSLTVAGAAAAYLGVVNGLGAMVPAGPASADAFAARPPATPDARRGQGPAPRTPVRATTAAGAPAPVRTAELVPLPATTHPRTPASPSPALVSPALSSPAAARPAPPRPAGPAGPDCDCDSPPVPTPTAPPSPPSPTGSLSMTPPDEPSAGESAGWPPGGWWDRAEPSPTGSSAAPAGEDGPSGRSHDRRRRHHDH